jgi:SagB-type dehydrogenase family enzyme
MMSEDQASELGLLYHLNSEPRRESFGATAARLPSFDRVHGERPAVHLPRPETDSPLMRIIQARRSCRAYRAGSLPLADLGEIVRGAHGMSRSLDSSDWPFPPTRAVPSAGGCYPLELYVAVWSVAGAEAGLYRYDILDHGLQVMRKGDLRSELCSFFLGQTEVRDACAILILAAVFQRTLVRYGARGYRYVLLEAGHAAQNACLIAGELGLGSLCLGGFFDARLNRFLGLDGVTEAVVYSVAIGYPVVS